MEFVGTIENTNGQTRFQCTFNINFVCRIDKRSPEVSEMFDILSGVK